METAYTVIIIPNNNFFYVPTYLKKKSFDIICFGLLYSNYTIVISCFLVLIIDDTLRKDLSLTLYKFA